MASSTEDFERDIIKALQLFLPAALAVTAAKYLTQDRQDGLADPDGTSWVELVAPARTEGGPGGMGDYYPGGVDMPTAWPSIEVAVPDLAVTNFSLGQQDADTETSLVLMIWQKDGRFPVLNRAMKRYAATVFSVLQSPSVLGSEAIREARFAWRTNPENPDDNDRITAGSLIFLTLDGSLVRA